MKDDTIINSEKKGIYLQYFLLNVECAIHTWTTFYESLSKKKKGSVFLKRRYHL